MAALMDRQPRPRLTGILDLIEQARRNSTSGRPD